jgi:hypothetical protein
VTGYKTLSVVDLRTGGFLNVAQDCVKTTSLISLLEFHNNSLSLTQFTLSSFHRGVL